jgi:hypothetical protein
MEGYYYGLAQLAIMRVRAKEKQAIEKNQDKKN